MSVRKLPNILVTGTPGTGKSTTAKMLQERAPALKYVDIGALVKEKQLHDGWDEEFESYVIDEDRVSHTGMSAMSWRSSADLWPHQICDEIEEQAEAGGVVVDYHGADLFPERWFELVLVLRSDNTVLYQRLESR